MFQCIVLDKILFVVKQENFTKALDILTTYEEENVLPSPRTLRYLGKVLKSHDMPVPFTIPEIPERVSVNHLASTQFIKE